MIIFKINSSDYSYLVFMNVFHLRAQQCFKAFDRINPSNILVGELNIIIILFHSQGINYQKVKWLPTNY